MKDFVPYESALELKELGFDEPCFGIYAIPCKKVFLHHYGKTTAKEQFGAPLYQQAFRWFREKYDIHYSINRECSQHDHKWGYNWSLYRFGEFITSHPDAPAGEWVYETYEEAELECLKKLIEIVKSKKR